MHQEEKLYSIEFEQSVLGCLMINNKNWDEVFDKINTEDFYDKKHQEIFTEISNLLNINNKVDILILGEVLKKKSKNSEDIFSYLAKIANATPNSQNIIPYAKVVQEYSILRKVSQASMDTITLINSKHFLDAEELLDKAESNIFAISEQVKNNNTNTIQTSKQLSPNVIDTAQDWEKNKGKIIGLSTGFSEFDRMTHGLQKSDLIVLAGPPSMGKTSFAMNIVQNVIKKEKDVLVFSLEMSKDQLMMRLFSSISGISMDKIKRGQLNQNDWGDFNNAYKYIYEKYGNIYIDDNAMINPYSIRSQARRIKRINKDLSLIVIDYLQLIKFSYASSGNANNSRYLELSDITRSLKGLAKELDIPVIVLSQLNRDLFKRNEKKPILSDLRDSGAIEQDADLVVFVHRDDYHNSENSENIERSNAEIIIAKHRNGTTGKFQLQFAKQYTRFENIAHNYQKENYSSNTKSYNKFNPLENEYSQIKDDSVIRDEDNPYF